MARLAAQARRSAGGLITGCSPSVLSYALTPAQREQASRRPQRSGTARPTGVDVCSDSCISVRPSTTQVIGSNAIAVAIGRREHARLQRELAERHRGVADDAPARRGASR